MKLYTSPLPRPQSRQAPRWSQMLLGSLGFLALLPGARAQRMTLADATAAPVVVESASVTTEVTGRIAVTTFELVFRNANARPLEGTFEFPLLEGQSVIRFALDIDGQLREAVPVEKERGRVAFEEISRRRADPGLLEQTAGNNYRARIFPLPANGTRRIAIAYQEDLGRGAAGESTYRLALDFPQRLNRFNLAVSVPSGDAGATVANTTLPLDLPAWNAARSISVDRSDFDARGVLELRLPPRTMPTLLTQQVGGREYFCVEVPLGANAVVPRAVPKVIGLLWDASGSGRERDHDKEFAFLTEWFRVVPEVEVRLVCLRDQAAPPETFRVRHGEWADLRQALEHIVYDGGTSFDGLKDIAAVQEWMLFSDGLMNFGTTSALARLPLAAPVHAVLACPRSDPGRLRGLATRQGGEFANLLGEEAAAAVARVRSSALRVLGIARDPEAVAQVFPEAGSPILQSNLLVTGLLRRRDATIRMQVGHSAADAREIVLSVKSGAGGGQLAARAWAAAKIAALSLDPADNREDIRRTSQEFGIVTADTSLIVLETLDDYVRYDILPPEELRGAWAARRNLQTPESKEARAEHLDEIVEAFAQRQEWWQTRFPKNREPRRDEPLVAAAPAGGSTRSTAPVLPPRESAAAPVAGAAAVPAPAPNGSAPVIAQAGGGGFGDSADEEVVVLSPFMVMAPEATGYHAATTLAGTRIRTELRDIGSAVSVVTGEFLRDIGATSNADLLQYTTGNEFGGVAGNFGGAQATGRIALQAWSPEAGYLEHLRRVPATERYSVYLEERADHARDAGFYLDVAGFFFEQKEAALALRILSNLAELQLEDAALLRVLGHRLVQAGRPELALPLFERVLKIRGEEPQSRRDLALACAATKQYQRAVDLLWEIVERPWDDRFAEVQLVALGELHAIVATCGKKLDLSKVDSRLRRNLPVGLRAVLTWDADSCDIDLWVDDPNEERAMYSHRRTRQGGQMSEDFTGGYGPEEFILREPKPGKYTVRINYYGDQRVTALGPVTAQVRLITGFGTSKQKEELLTVRLTSDEETLEIGSIEIP